MRILDLAYILALGAGLGLGTAHWAVAGRPAIGRVEVGVLHQQPRVLRAVPADLADRRPALRRHHLLEPSGVVAIGGIDLGLQRLVLVVLSLMISRKMTVSIRRLLIFFIR